MAIVNSDDGVVKTGKAEIFTSEYALKKRRIAETSILSHRELVASGKKKTQNDIMIEIVSEHQPLTVREAWRLSGIEQTSASRSISELTTAGRLKVAFNKKSSNGTNRLVGYYTLSDWMAEPEQSQAA